MTRTLLLSAVLLAGLQTSLAAQTVPGSGEFYLPACRSLASGDASAPVEYTLGSLDCAISIDDLNGMSRILPTDSRFCKPADITVPQMAGIAVGYISAHADQQKDSFMTLAGKAFREKWPCP